MKLKVILIFSLFLAINLVMPEGFAKSKTELFGTMHVGTDSSDGPFMRDTWGIYLREQYERTGRSFIVRGDVEGYPLEQGETWEVTLIENYYRNSAMKIIYSAGCFYQRFFDGYNWSGLYKTPYCVQQTDPAGPYYAEYYELNVLYWAKSLCFKDKTKYFIPVQIGTSRPDWDVGFTPTNQIAGEIRASTYPSEIHPLVNQVGLYSDSTCLGAECDEDLTDIPAEVAKINVTTYDRHGCGQRARNAPIKIESLVDNSIPHLHFGSNNNKGGTGEFFADETYKPQYPPSGEAKSWVRLKTNSKGWAIVEYTAGKYGVKETLKESLAWQLDVFSTQDLLIQVPGLKKIDKTKTRDPEGNTVYIVGSYGNTCDKQHNAGNQSRHSDYLTESAEEQLVRMDELYYAQFGEHLCLNDASLKYGGFYDKGNANREDGCHKGHRRGIGIDVNNKAVGVCPSNLNTETTVCPLLILQDPHLKTLPIDELADIITELGGLEVVKSYLAPKAVSKGECLNEVARKLNYYKVDEEDYHYRFWP